MATTGSSVSEKLEPSLYM